MLSYFNSKLKIVIIKPSLIAAILKARWRNCIQGLMNSVSLKQKNDRLFRPFKYAREMIFYLQTRGVKFSDIYDTEVIDGIEEPTIKTEVQYEDDGTPKNKKIKLADTSATYRSPRLREKQMNSADITTPTNTQKAQQIKRTPASINTSNTSMQESNSDDIEMAEEGNEEEILNNHMEQEIVYPRADVATNQTTGICINESEAADQAFFDSIKPALRKMNETQKLDFQIDILQILKTFRSN